MTRTHTSAATGNTISVSDEPITLSDIDRCYRCNATIYEHDLDGHRVWSDANPFDGTRHRCPEDEGVNLTVPADAADALLEQASIRRVMVEGQSTGYYDFGPMPDGIDPPRVAWERDEALLVALRKLARV